MTTKNDEWKQTGDVELDAECQMTTRDRHHLSDVTQRPSFQRPAVDSEYPITLL